MNRENMEALLIAYIQNDLDANESRKIEKLIHEDEEVNKLYQQFAQLEQVMQSSPTLEPQASLLQKFEKDLASEQARVAQKSNQRFLFFTQAQVWRSAAAFALIATGLFLGLWIAGNNQSSNNEMAALREEIELTRRMMFEALNSSGSASARIQAVNASEHISKADLDILNVLIKTMNEDENTNVRLAAIRALARFETEEKVKQAFIASLEIQKDPILQITLINILVELNDLRAKENLQKLIENNETLETVKDEAYLAIFRLS